MKNGIFEELKSKVLIKVEGKNLERFIHRLRANHIELLDIKYFKDAITILVYQKDLAKIEEIKTIYSISIIDSKGYLALKKHYLKNRLFFFFLVFGLLMLFIVTHLVDTIEIVHTDPELRKLLKNELENHGIVENRFRQSFDSLAKIKQSILERNKDKIEWLEIERVGMKYIVRVEERKLPKPEEKKDYGHIVAKKSAIIKDIYAESGVIVKNRNDYVKPGDIIISGEIKLNDEIKGYEVAKGQVYGEVWYKMTVDYPFLYQEKKYTGKKKQVLTLKILSHRFELTLKPFKDKKITEKVLFKDLIFPFSLVLETQEEYIFKEEINTEEMAINKAMELAKVKMESKLNDNEKIISQKNLKVDIKKSKITLEVFFTVYEDITDYLTIPKPEGGD